MSGSSTVTGTAGQSITHTPGAFVWHELRTTDVAKAKDFYAALFGWTYQPSSVPGVDYTRIALGGKPVGGIFNSQGHEMPAHWGCFISVPDVDAAAEKAKAAGGEVCAGPQDIPGVARFVMVNDPQGVNVALYKSVKGDPDTSHVDPGMFCWDELHTTDIDAAAAFYGQVIGWTAETYTPEGGVFKYGELMEASYGKLTADAPPHWMPFILVTDLNDAGQRAAALGATVHVADLPAGDFGRFSIIQDPVGAHVGLFQGNEG